MWEGFMSRLAALPQTVVSKMLVRSALNPILWLCGISTIPCFFLAAYAFRNNSFISTVLVLVAAFVIIVACFGFIYFLFNSPEKLQSENFQIRHESLRILRDKGESLGVYIEEIVNPDIKQLESPEEEN